MVLPATVERRGFTVDEYHRMGEVGILGPEERTELIEGVIVRMSPIGGWHNVAVTRLNRVLTVALLARAVIQVQGPVRLSQRSEPQPDIAVLDQSVLFGRALPTAADVYLLIEVADTTLAYDRETKVGLYAAAGVPEVWVVDLNGDRVLVFRGPTADGYLEQRTVPRGEAVTPMRLPDVTLAVADIIG